MIHVPGKHVGKRLTQSKVLGKGLMRSRSGFADLNVTPLVDMFVILVLFLIANFSATGEILPSSKDIELPVAANTGELQDAPAVMISTTQMLVSGKSLGRLDDLTRGGDLNIPDLEEALRDLKKRFEDLHAAANDTGAFRGDVNIQADKKVPYRVIKRVMVSCTAAGYSNLAFATMAAGSEDKAVD